MELGTVAFGFKRLVVFVIEELVRKVECVSCGSTCCLDFGGNGIKVDIRRNDIIGGVFLATVCGHEPSTESLPVGYFYVSLTFCEFTDRPVFLNLLVVAYYLSVCIIICKGIIGLVLERGFVCYGLAVGAYVYSYQH